MVGTDEDKILSMVWVIQVYIVMTRDVEYNSIMRFGYEKEYKRKQKHIHPILITYPHSIRRFQVQCPGLDLLLLLALLDLLLPSL